MDVEDREIRPAGLQQADRIRRGRGRDHPQAEAVAHVIASGQGLVDAGVNGIGGEIQDQRRDSLPRR